MKTRMCAYHGNHSSFDNPKNQCCVLCVVRRAFADSKTLSAEQRERLFGSIQEDPLLGYCAEILSAHHISALMLGR